jgi:phosphoglycerol transferase MdoB-like AlkP superfamily enzyme
MLNWKQATESGADVLLAFVYGIRLDLAMVCYLSVIPVLLWCLAHYTLNKVWVNRLLKGYTIVLLVLVMLIAIVDGELYQHWGQKLNAYASSFAKFPKDMLAFSVSGSNLTFLLIVIGFSGLAYILYAKGMKGLDEVSGNVKGWQPIVVTVLLLGVLFIGIRGGVGKAAINQSSAFYSATIFLNHTAINATWNLMASMIDTPEETKQNVYAFTDDTKAQQLLTALSYTPKGFPVLFSEPNPNIVLIILEGWTADVIAPLGGEANVTPFFNEICKEGLLFTNFYANGNRTDKGLAAIISSQPALAHSSIINNIQKFTSLPSIPSVLKERQYRSFFYYGGASEFANMKGYWLNAGYEKIVDLESFPFGKRSAEWGVHDDVLFDKVLSGLNEMPSPFFVTALTLSSHEPFKVPFTSEFTKTTDDDLYRNAVKFSDQSLGTFFAKAKTQPWYDHTVMIVLADHGHQWPLDRKAYDPDRFRIPFLVTGGALKQVYRGRLNPTIAGQVDLAAILLGQLGLSSDAFTWSKNVLDSAYKPFATYTYNDGIGMIVPKGRVVFDQESKQVIWLEGDSTTMRITESQARAYEQMYFEEYRNR